MAEKRTRYNELLDVPNEIRDPDYYQLLGLERLRFDPAQVEERFREQMRKLQSIKSPKHKSFIEFLKGELRTAKTTLTKDNRRQKYDAELLEERRDQLARILDVVLADGVLEPAEEERIHDVALDVGLTPEETANILEDELATRGATRGGEAAEPEPEPEPSSPPKRSITRVQPHEPTPDEAPPPERIQTDPKVAEAIKAAIDKRLRATARRKAVQKDEDDVIVAEYVGPPRKPKSDWQQTSRPARSTGWGKASKMRSVGVCSACLKPVDEMELKKGKAERLADGRLHCAGCTNRLVAGLICASCYHRITRAEVKAGQLVHRAGRVRHGRCAR